MPDGATKWSDVNGHCRAADDSPGKVEVELDAGHVTYWSWSGLGEYRIRVPRPDGAESNELVLNRRGSASRTQGLRELHRQMSPGSSVVAAVPPD